MKARRTDAGRRRGKGVRDPAERRLKNRKRAEAAPQGFVTRRVLRENVGLSESQLRVLISKGVVTADGVNSSGYALYNTTTVARLLRMKGDGSLFRAVSPTAAATPNVARDAATVILPYSAEDGVRVFELLREGRTLVEIILATKIHPLVVKTIRIDYDDIAGSICLTKDIVAQINELGDAGKLQGGFPVRTAEDVFQAIELCATDRTCSICETNAALTSCESCLTQARRASRRGAAGSDNEPAR